MKKICIVIGSRAHYSSIKSAMRAVKAHPDLQLQLIVGASALLERYGSLIDLITQDGFKVDAKVYMLVEGETPATMVKTTGLGLIELSTIFDRLSPDVVMTVGDRFETMATTLAAAYMNFPIAHTMGGEVSGTIDESIRHAITKFAHIHFPASPEAKQRIIQLGEDPDFVHLVGCPRMDLINEYLQKESPDWERQLFDSGVGVEFDLSAPFLLVSQHPVTTEYGAGEQQILETLTAVEKTGLPAIILWPNADAGSEDVARGMRKWREQKPASPFYYVKNLPIEIYVYLMQRTACLIGNSSSGIRDGSFIGTPTVNVGSRQNARERGENVLDTSHQHEEIYKAITQQLEHGPYARSTLYGDGHAGEKIVEVLNNAQVSVQKTIHY